MELWQGDCLELMDRIGDKTIDFILCDLPYGTTRCKWDEAIPFDKLWEQYNRIIKDNGVIALFGTEPFSSKLRLSQIEKYKYDWIWDKVKPNGHIVAKLRPMQRTETISIFCKPSSIYYPIMTDREKKVVSKEYKRSEIIKGTPKEGNEKVLDKKYPTNVLVFSNANQKNKVHPTQKPIELLEYLIKTYTLENEIVLDNCMGSGSTGVACKKLNRNFIGIEKDEKYFNIAKERIESA